MIHIYRIYPYTQGYSWSLSVNDIPELSTAEAVTSNLPKESAGTELFTVSNKGKEEMNCSIVLPRSALFSSNNDLISVYPDYSFPNPNDRDLSPRDELTISCWVYLNDNIECDAQNNWRILVSKGIAFNGNGGYDIILEENGNLTFSVGTTGGLVRYHTNKQVISLHKWTHITATFNALTGKAYIYDNGIKTTGAYWSTATGEIVNNYDPLLISSPSAYECQEGYGYFPGIIDEVSIWNRILTDEEISSGMLDQLRGNETGLIGFWDFDEIEEGRVFDLSPSHNVGYASNVNDYYQTPFEWFSISPLNFKVPAGSTFDINIDFNTEGLESGTYFSKFAIKADDPRAAYTIIPVTLHTGETSVQPAVRDNSGAFLITVGPNPFTKQTNFKMELQEPGEMVLSIFDMQGRVLEKLSKQIPSAGVYSLEFYNSSLSEGIYFYRAEFSTTQGHVITQTGKLIVPE